MDFQPKPYKKRVPVMQDVESNKSYPSSTVCYICRKKGYFMGFIENHQPFAFRCTCAYGSFFDYDFPSYNAAAYPGMKIERDIDKVTPSFTFKEIKRLVHNWPEMRDIIGECYLAKSIEIIKE